jgi:hypothetical protein
MDSQANQQIEAANTDSPENLDRRDAVRKLGKFAAYAAPFTIMALTVQRASAASGNGPLPSGAAPKSSPAHH